MPVDHSHIVPAMYLRRWADENDCLEMLLVEHGSTKRVPVKEAGVRGGGFYKRERPSGERSDDIETVSLHRIENATAPILRGLEDQWPLDGNQKATVAMFVAAQLVRGPRWFEWHKRFAVDNLGRFREEGRFKPRPGTQATEEEIHRAALEHVQGSTERLMTMLRLTSRIASAFGSMHWSLIRFSSPALATSDHPVVVWPPADRGRSAEPASPGEIGIGNLFEVRLPTSPSTAVLMTWRDVPDDSSPLRGRTHHAENLNAFTIAEAEKAWFFGSGARRPRCRSGNWMPVAPELVSGYSIHEAAFSQRRRDILTDLQGRIGEEIEAALEARIRHIPHAGELS